MHHQHDIPDPRCRPSRPVSLLSVTGTHQGEAPYSGACAVAAPNNAHPSMTLDFNGECCDSLLIRPSMSWMQDFETYAQIIHGRHRIRAGPVHARWCTLPL